MIAPHAIAAPVLKIPPGYLLCLLIEHTIQHVGIFCKYKFKNRIRVLLKLTVIQSTINTDLTESKVLVAPDVSSSWNDIMRELSRWKQLIGGELGAVYTSA